MMILEAFRNRGLLASETYKPVYRITYGNNRYDKQTVEITAEDQTTAKQELTEKWREYARRNGIREDSVIEIHCVRNGWEAERGSGYARRIV